MLAGKIKKHGQVLLLQPCHGLLPQSGEILPVFILVKGFVGWEIVPDDHRVRVPPAHVFFGIIG
jgi:hypothetical protein